MRRIYPRLLAVTAIVAGLLALVPTPAQAAETAVLHVDAGRGLDAMPDGSSSKPFPTIAWAVAHGQALRKEGRSVHVLVAPGTYRESVNIGAAGSNPPLVVESTTPGGAVVTGADVEERWTAVPGTAHLESPWTENWGLTPVPAGWSGVTVPDGVRRREAVFIDGAPLVQVLAEDELAPNTFFVDEGADRLVVHPPAGVSDLGDHLVEVAYRDRILHVKAQASSVTVKGFVFEAAATPLEKYMAYVSDSTDVVIEGNVFRHSSWSGLGICCTVGVTIRGNRAIDNGGNGIDTYKTTRALIESNVITGNNVRGARHGYVGWSVAGSKNLLLSQGTFRHNTYSGNHARGLWLDTDVQDVLIDGDRSCGNLRDGLFVEATQGPLTIQDSTFCHNGGGGIVVGTSGNVSVQRSTMSDNAYGQLVFTGERSRQWTDRLTGGLITMGDFSNWSLVGNTFSSTGAARLIYSPVIPIDEWRQLLRDGEIRASGNTWTRPSMDGAIRIQATDFPMDEWRSLTGDSLSATPPPPGRSHPFTDVAGNHHEPMIAEMWGQGVTTGCTSDGTRYCPARFVQRGQMATFLTRALDLPAASRDHFPDDDGTVHEDSINRVAEAGIAFGRAGRFEPGEAVTREQMASFLARGFDLPPAPTSYPDVSPTHAPSVGAIEAAEITAGCNAAGTRFCGRAGVRRDQMASFLGRALDVG